MGPDERTRLLGVFTLNQAQSYVNDFLFSDCAEHIDIDDIDKLKEVYNTLLDIRRKLDPDEDDNEASEGVSQDE